MLLNLTWSKSFGGTSNTSGYLFLRISVWRPSERHWNRSWKILDQNTRLLLPKYLSSLSPPSMFAILSHIRGGALPKGRPKVLKDHTLLRFSMCRWRQTRLLGHAMRSARACRHRSHRIFRIKRELLKCHTQLSLWEQKMVWARRECQWAIPLVVWLSPVENGLTPSDLHSRSRSIYSSL